MSADDFQTKYASVMDGMLKSAVAETTKLFETMVDELKAEILRLKTENDDLRTKCVQFENTKSQAHVCPTESEPLPGASDGSEKRDTAVQCGELLYMLANVTGKHYQCTCIFMLCGVFKPRYCVFVLNISHVSLSDP